MYIPLDDTIILLLLTAMLFYLLPKYKIKWQILVIIIWLCGVGCLIFASYMTNDNQIFITNKNHLMEI